MSLQQLMVSYGHLKYDFRTMQLCRDLDNLFSNQPYINIKQLLIITQPYHQVLSHLQVWVTISIAFCMMTVNATVNSSNLGLHTYIFSTATKVVFRLDDLLTQ